MNFVSVVGINLLTSLSICLSQLQVIILHLEGKKKLPVDFKPTKWVPLVFLDAVDRGGLGSIIFSFPVVLSWWLHLGYNIHKYPFSRPSTHSIAWPHCPYVPGWHL